MRYRTTFTSRASREIADICEDLNRRAPRYAPLWVERLESAVRSLRSMPQRCPPAHEYDDLHFQARQLLFDSYRIVFRIIGAEVIVLHVKHEARDRKVPED